MANIIIRGSHWATVLEIQLFENEISQYVERKYTAVFNSGDSALHALLLAHNIRTNELIVPSLIFISTADAPLFVTKPVFEEIEDKKYGLYPEDVKERITPQTKVIIPIYYGGGPCLIRESKETADDCSVLLIEYTAEFGASIKDKMYPPLTKSEMDYTAKNSEEFLEVEP